MKILLTVGILAISSLSIAKNRELHGEVKTTDMSSSLQAVWTLSDEEAPIYPRALAVSEIEGCAVLSFTINMNGKAEDIAVVNSSPNKKLKKYSIKTLEELKWSPIDNNSQKAEQKVLRVDYCIESSQAQVAQKCAKRIESPCQ